MLDRDESALHAVQLTLHGRALLDSEETVLADIRDPRRIREVFEKFRPDIVFHAAALKHLPLLEQLARPRRSRPTSGEPSRSWRPRPSTASSRSSTSRPTRPRTR